MRMSSEHMHLFILHYHHGNRYGVYSVYNVYEMKNFKKIVHLINIGTFGPFVDVPIFWVTITRKVFIP